MDLLKFTGILIFSCILVDPFSLGLHIFMVAWHKKRGINDNKYHILTTYGDTLSPMGYLVY